MLLEEADKEVLKAGQSTTKGASMSGAGKRGKKSIHEFLPYRTKSAQIP